MKRLQNMLLVILVIAAGGLATSTFDWARERRMAFAGANREAERMVGLLALYPFHDMDAWQRNLLAKTLVEQSATDVAYVLVYDHEARPLLVLGDSALRSLSEVTVGSDHRPQAGRRQFVSLDGKGTIIEFTKVLIQRGQTGTVQLGLRVLSPPLFSMARTGTVATAVFLMLAALIVGYYTIVLALRRWARESNAAAAASGRDVLAAGGASGDVLRGIKEMKDQLIDAREKLRTTTEHNANLSSRLGVALFEAQQAYRVLDGLDSGILILDPQDRIRRINRTLLGLLGGERSVLEGHTYGEAITHPGLVLCLDGGSDADPESPEAEIQFEETAPGRTFHVTRRPLPDATGESIGTLITVQDVTRMVRARKSQEEFVAEVVHELLTPLTGIKTYAELLMTGDVSDTEMQRELFNTINSETDRLTALVRNLLSVAQMEVGSLTLDRTIVRTDWLLEQCLPAIQGSAKEKEITLEQRMPDTFPVIMGDKDMLQVCLVNLLGNAIKYTPPKGSVRFAMFEEDHHVVFEISDTGYGIPADELPHIFEKFYRGNTMAVREQVGSGLGLATTHQIVRLHGGTIDAASEPGEGSCFTMRIPAEEYSLEKQ